MEERVDDAAEGYVDDAAEGRVDVARLRMQSSLTKYFLMSYLRIPSPLQQVGSSSNAL